MLLEEWNWEEAKEVWLEEGMETGLKMAKAPKASWSRTIWSISA
jgi:hypothetical protein